MDYYDILSKGGRVKPLIILTGPTAVGKTALSIELAKRLGGEIISADSMQVFRGMDIGTAKISPEEMDGVRHHLIDIKEPDEEFSVMAFKDLAQTAVEDILSRRKIPIVAGGTGFYIQALLYDVDFTSYEDETQARIRAKLNQMLESKGALYMHEYLRRIDPESAAIIHMNNTKRLLHAIEYFEITGQKISDHNADQHARSSPYNFAYLVLNDDRARVYERIDKRVDLMIEAGLVDEVKRLMDKGYNLSHQSMLGLGYKEIYDYLTGLTDLEEAVYLIKRDTRHFAKKQLTWFKREKETIFIDKGAFAQAEELTEYTIDLLLERMK